MIHTQKKYLFAFSVLLLLCLVLVFVKAPPSEWTAATKFAEYIAAKGVIGYLIFLTVAALSTSIGLPRQFFAFAAGFTFGIGWGLMLSLLAATAGCALTFYCSKQFFAAKVAQRYPQAASSLNKLIEEDAFLKIIVLRLQPLGTNFVTNVSAGISNIKPSLFLMSSWLGFLPQMYLFCLLGAGVRVGSHTYQLVSLSMLTVSVILGSVLYQRFVNRLPNS